MTLTPQLVCPLHLSFSSPNLTLHSPQAIASYCASRRRRTPACHPRDRLPHTISKQAVIKSSSTRIVGVLYLTTHSLAFMACAGGI